MPKNVMKLIKPSPHRSRNDFDLSHRHVLTQNMGELIPATCIETVPGDHIEISVANLMRCIPLVTSPFMRVKQHVDIWFVPYRDLWHNFDAFITQRDQPVSSALQSSNYLPSASIYDLYQYSARVPGGVDIVGRPMSQTSAKLLHYLGYADESHALNTAPSVVNLFRLAAYQYIWYNEYRQQYYDDGTYALASGASPATLFNFDDLPCNTPANADIQASSTNPSLRIAGMCQLRYRCWKKDLFTGLMPATQFGNVSIFESSSFDQLGAYTSTGGVYANTRLLTVSSGVLKASDGATAGSSLPNNLANNPLYFDIHTSNDILALRKSEAIQIWRENALRAGNRTADNMRAHYGVESDFRDHRPTYIGSVDAPLNIGDVMTTANSDYSGNTNPNTNVGDIAGKGTSTLRDNKFRFDSKDFGVIMAISSLLPEAEYNAYGIDRMNQLLESEDFFIPEYENLGLEAVGSANFINLPTTGAKVVGYAPRYYGYKTRLDKCFGAFMTNGLFAPWCTPKSDVTTALNTQPGVMPLACLYVNPTLFNVNFSVNVGTSEQFLNDIYFDVDAVRPMSVTGLPFS